jgi:regulatory protein
MDYKTAFNKASSLCSRQEYCMTDIRNKLEKWEVSECDCQKILDQLVDENFIDESRFATFYVRDKFRFNRWGRKKIWWQLKQKKLSDKTIQQALKQIEEEEYRETLTKIDREKSIQLEK